MNSNVMHLSSDYTQHERRQAPPPLWHVAAHIVLAACLMSVAPAGLAGPLAYSNILLEARAQATDDSSGPIEDAPPNVLVAPDDPRTHEALLQPDWERAPMSTSSLPAGFVSAAMTADGVGGVGVSGYRRGGPNGSADAGFGRDITNVGATASYLDLTWEIPMIEVSMADTDSFDGIYPSGYPSAYVSARLAYALFDAVGDVVDGGFLFDYTAQLLQVSRDADDIAFVELSDDLQSLTDASCDLGQCLRSAIRDTVGPHEVFGYRWAPFSDTVLGFELLPGYTLALNYLMTAMAYGGDPNIVDDADLSIQALIGDPFDIASSGARFTIRESASLPPPVSVPEPGVASLLALGMGLLVARRRRARVVC